MNRNRRQRAVKNYEHLHTFVKGLRGDYNDLAESNNSYVTAENVRLISENGTLSLSSVKGTKEFYNNPNVLKYLGFCAFEDELVLAAKVKREIISEEAIESKSNYEDPYDFNIKLNCSNLSSEVDLNDYYQDITGNHNGVTCSLEEQEGISNLDVLDCFISLKNNELGQIESKIVWVGNLNWSFDAKVICFGLYENNFYKRVYFTDYINKFKVINLKDNEIFYRSGKELEAFKNGILLRPEVLNKIKGGGSIMSGVVLYTYRLISDTGSASEYAAMSNPVYIEVDSTKQDFRGGIPAELSNYAVEIKIDNINKSFHKIEAVAVEYGAKGTPTAIRSLGTKEIQAVNRFFHYGTEAEFTDSITIAQLLQKKNNWRYCSDLESKNNRLFASGLRNEPLPVELDNYEKNFYLRGWEPDGTTHGCLINPTPSKYAYIWAGLNETYRVPKKIYNSIQVFGKFEVSIVDANTGSSISKNFESNVQDYQNFNAEIAEWISTIPVTEMNDKFPGVTISVIDNTRILFEGQDVADIGFRYNTSQVIQDVKEDVKWNLSADSSGSENQKIRGYQSLGYSKGNGVRITFRSEFDKIMTAQERYDGYKDETTGASNIIDVEKPTFNKGWMKGEIYRLGIKFFDLDGFELFTTPLGDIKVPVIGEGRSFVKEDGSAYLPRHNGDNIKNAQLRLAKDDVVAKQQTLNELYSERLEMLLDVRLSCDMKKFISSYQLVYVKREGNNRTIMSQGICGPLERVGDIRFKNADKSTIDPEQYYRGKPIWNLDERVINKWQLPHGGGPLYDFRGYEKTEGLQDDFTIDHDRDLFQENRNAKNMTALATDIVWFDSPETDYNFEDESLIAGAKLEYCALLWHDHPASPNGGAYNSNYDQKSGYDWGFDYKEDYIPFNHNDRSGHGGRFGQALNKDAGRRGLADGDANPRYMMSTVFAHEFRNITTNTSDNSKRIYPIEFHREMKPGEIISGSDFKTKFQVSNNALCIGRPAGFFREENRRNTKRESGGRSAYELWKSHNIAEGVNTIFMKVSKPLFSSDGILVGTSNGRIPNKENENANNQNNHRGYRAYVRNDTDRNGSFEKHVYHDAVWEQGQEGHGDAYGSGIGVYPLMNLVINTENSVYGGREESQIANSVYIPISKVIPVNKEDNRAKRTQVQGDVFCTLYSRQKTWGNPNTMRDIHGISKVNTTYDGGTEWEIGNATNHPIAWIYSLIVETTIEPRLTSERQPYAKAPIQTDVNPMIPYNEAYLQGNDLKKSVGTPIDFKDDPNQNNMIAASQVKANGDIYDSFTEFPVNDFYELEKNKGTVHNLVKQENEIYAIQADQTSLLYIDQRSMTNVGGDEVSVLVGDGSAISYHKVISNFGTRFRRAVVQSRFGFVFFDEEKFEFVKINKGLLVNNSLNLVVRKLFENNKIKDVEPFFDEKYKESNILIKGEQTSYCLSYNEAFQVFNGFIQYDNDLYINWNESIFAPQKNTNNLHELNQGIYLNFFGEQKNMKIGIICNGGNPNGVKIFKHLGINTNIDYNVTEIDLETALNQQRVITGNHHRYKIREGVHSVPLKNRADRDDLRGTWLKVEVELESLNQAKIDVFSFINFVRNSYI